MRNLKRALSLALASVMLLGMMVVGTGAFEDVSESHNEEAIAVMELAGIMIGDDKGNFNPDKKVTRNEMAVVMANMLGLDVADYAGLAPFTDVPAWAEAYVSACYANGIVSGTSATTYTGDANVTAVEAGLMVMKALGYFQYASDFGSDWKVAAIKQASKIDLYEDVVAKTNDALTRNEVAQLAFNGLMAAVVDVNDTNLAVGENGNLYNVYTYGPIGTTLEDKLFGKTADDCLTYDDTKTNDLNQKVVTWTLKATGEKTKTATVTKAAELVYVNAAKAEDIEKDLKAAELAEGTEATQAATIAGLTANGKTVYVYEDLTTAVVTKQLATVGTIASDKVSTPDKDERAITIDGKKIAADNEVVTDATEVDNFETLYKTLKTDDKVIIVLDKNSKIASVEIPETVTAKVTRAKDEEFVAGGETYKVITAQKANVNVSKEQKIIVLDGVAYSVEDAQPDTSKVIYVDKKLGVETDKFGGKTYTVQIVNEKFEIAEMVIDETSYNTTVTEGEFYTYEWDSENEYYTLKDATADEITENVSVDVDKDDIKLAAGKYYAADVQFVYIEKSGKDLAVTVKTGAQIVNGTVDYIYDTDAEEVTIVYVYTAYDNGMTDDVVFVADKTDSAAVVDKKGDPATEYTVYVDGAEKTWMLKTGKDGFYTYKLDEETGVYELKDQKGHTVDVVKNTTITKDKYVNATVTIDGSSYTIADATVKAIYDLTDEGLTTLALINGWDGDPLEISFMYDKEDNVITALYVEFAPAAAE